MSCPESSARHPVSIAPWVRSPRQISSYQANWQCSRRELSAVLLTHDNGAKGEKELSCFLFSHTVSLDGRSSRTSNAPPQLRPHSPPIQPVLLRLGGHGHLAPSEGLHVGTLAFWQHTDDCIPGSDEVEDGTICTRIEGTGNSTQRPLSCRAYTAHPTYAASTKRKVVLGFRGRTRRALPPGHVCRSHINPILRPRHPSPLPAVRRVALRLPVLPTGFEPVPEAREASILGR